MTLDCVHLDRELTTVPESVIISQNYPNNYDLNSKCAATVKFEQSENIVLYFGDFNIQGDSECSKDYLEVSSVSKENRTILKQLCGPTIPAPIVLNDTTAYLYFHSDNSLTDTGFVIYLDRGKIHLFLLHHACYFKKQTYTQSVVNSNIIIF